MSRIVTKPWGQELIWCETERYAAKVLSINAGERLSLQTHNVKDEAIYVLKGCLRLETESDGELVEVLMYAGSHARIAPGTKHRFGAVTDCDVLEVSTPELDDIVRHEDDYGRLVFKSVA